LAAIFTLGFVKAASADVATVDNFTVILNGTTIFSDSFGAGLTLAGGNPPGATLPSGQNFSNGTPANYGVIGTVTEAGNKGILDSALGGNFGGVASLNNTDLQTGPPTSPFSLTQNDAFTTTALYNLSVPSNVGGFYQIELTSSTASNSGDATGDVISVDVCTSSQFGGILRCGSATGPIIQMFDRNFDANTGTVIGQAPLVTSNQQILFELSHPTPGTPDVFGSYAYVNGGVEGPLTPLGDYTGLFQSLNYAQPGFTQLTATPEPSSLMLLAPSIPSVLGLAWLRRRRAVGARSKIGPIDLFFNRRSIAIHFACREN
jgi:hypothetical protein